MFDVSWSDPKRETVGQRKERKEKEASGGGGGVHSSSSSVRSSKSSQSNDSVRQSTRISLLTFLNSNRKENSKKDGIGRGGASPNLVPRVPKDDDNHSHRYSSYTDIGNSIQEESSEPTTPKAVEEGYYMTAPDNRHSVISNPTNGSVFSARTGRSVATNTSWGSIIESSRKPSLVQPLSPKSFVTQTTEVTVSSGESIHSIEQLATVVHISSNGSHSGDMNKSSSNLSASLAPFDSGAQRTSSETLSIADEEALLEPSNWPTWKPPESWDNQEDEQTLPILPIIPPLSPPPPQSPLPSLPRQSTSSPTKRSRRKAVPTSINTRPNEMSHLQKSIRLKEAATPRIMLERLKEEWMVNADASMFRDLEMEKQLWMLTALRAECKYAAMVQEEQNGTTDASTSPTAQSEKILSLYENHACAAFLSAISPHAEIHHLSPTPIPSTLVPHIHPLVAPRILPQLPYPPAQFSHIHAFPLSSALLPSSSIPQLLTSIHSCLVPHTGRLHLTMIDPSPAPPTVGPKLRAWLDAHLITNLERQFRCLNPSRLLPLWLSDAALRGEGSVIRAMRFRAVEGLEIGGAGGTIGSGCCSGGIGGKMGMGGESHGCGVGEELGSLLGRMLWREMWGSFVEGREWWWECEEIVEECQRMGTCWEYCVIEAVREG